MFTVTADTFLKINLRENKNTNTIKMKEDIDLFCWQVPELKKYLQQERGIPFRGEGGWWG